MNKKQLNMSMPETPFELNPLERLLHINNLTGLADRMSKLVTDFENKNPDKKELIEEKKKTCSEVADAGIYLINLYEKAKDFENKNLHLKIENAKLSIVIETLKRRVDKAEEMYKGLVEFDNKK